MINTPIVVIALFGWVPLVILLFALLPPRRAAVIAIVGGWLFLPPVTFPISGLPDFSKITAANLGIIFGTALFHPGRLLSFRPKWFDLPMFLFCWSPMASALSNDLGPYDGLSSSLFIIFMWGMPYFTGRLYFNNIEALRDLCNGILVGGLVYVPLCLIEIRLSPQIMRWVYGFHSWQGTRLGGYRPHVFFRTGLELGMWMAAVSMVAWWMWRGGATKKSWNVPLVGKIPFGMVLLPSILVTTLLCRSTGALVLLLCGAVVLWLSARFRTRLPLATMIFLVCLYSVVRSQNLWSGANAVAIAKAVVGEDRAQSLEFRFQCEDLLIARALERPFFGWGGWGRSGAYWDDEQKSPVTCDGLWIITLGAQGTVGLVLLYSAVLLPVIVMMRRFPAWTWNTPAGAPAAVCGALLSMYMYDLLLNAFVNMIYIVLAGSLISVAPPKPFARKRSPGREESEQAPAMEKGRPADTNWSPAAISKARQAEGYSRISRSITAEERPDIALLARRQSLDLLGQAWVLHPDDMAIRKRWCDSANDLAWSLANHPSPSLRNPTEAVELAGRASIALPNENTYWNTLGAARFRAGDFPGAIACLERSIELGGGSDFDSCFLAMAHAKLGDQEQAEHWLSGVHPWTAFEQTNHLELRRLFEEARSVLAAGPAAAITAG